MLNIFQKECRDKNEPERREATSIDTKLIYSLFPKKIKVKQRYRAGLVCIDCLSKYAVVVPPVGTTFQLYAGGCPYLRLVVSKECQMI